MIIKYLLHTIVCILVISNCKAQDIFSLENSKKYSSYLLKSGQYSLAAKEYERMLFFDSLNQDIKVNLLRSYRLSNQIDMGINRTKAMFPIILNTPQNIAIEYSKLLLVNKDWEVAESFWNNAIIMGADNKQLLNTSLHIFNADFNKAKASLLMVTDTSNFLRKGYADILENEMSMKRKSPALAGIFSAIVPGSGKAYTNNWKDGLVSMIFTGGMAFQSYRSFNKNGINNFRGWLFGGIGLGFYIGNVAGSVKSAKNYNTKKINILQHEASSLFNIYF